MLFTRILLISLTLLTATSVNLGQTPTTIDFEQFSGPSVFTGVQPPLSVGVATFSGGQVLNATSFLPANPTKVYGTAFFCAGCLPTITIDFAQGISNFSAFVMNGQVFAVTYTVQDDQGGMQTLTLFPNFSSGAGTFTLPSTNIRRVTIRGSASDWDFFVDNLRFFLGGLELKVGLGSGPSAPGTETVVVDDIVRTARVPLGSTFFVQLLQEQNGSKVPVDSSFDLEPAAISPSLVGAALFPNHVALEFDSNAGGSIKFFQAVHLGEVFLNITPTDSSTSPVKVRIRVNSPLKLGDNHNDIDSVLTQIGHQKGIPPQMLKGQIRQESNFRREAYRYEPLSVDLNYISRGQNLRTQNPYSLYRLSTTDGLSQGTDILTADISPRSIYSINRNGTVRPIADSDQLVSIREIFELNDATNNWGRFSPARVATLQQNPNLTAQTPLAASFGYLQVLYSTAISPMQWAGVNGARNPSLLFDTESNLAAGGGSLELGSGYMRRIFSRANPTISQQNPSFSNHTNFDAAFERAFNVYNRGVPTGPYGSSVLNFSRGFAIAPSTAIFP
jgi:hypothetical protein